MSFASQPKRTPVIVPDRAPMTPARRRRVWEAHDRRCGICRVEVPLKGTVIDHAIARWFSGDERDENLRPLCPACDKPKTAIDKRDIAKIKRLLKRQDGIRRPSRLRSRPLSKHPTLKRGFDGRVISRERT